MFIEAANALTPTTPTIPTGAVVAIFSAYLMDFLKRLNSLPKVTYFSTKLNAWIRVALSGVGTLGVSWSWSSHWSWSGAGAAMITIPAGSVLAVGVYHWAEQFCITHFSEIILAQRQVAKAAILAQSDQKPAVIEGK